MGLFDMFKKKDTDGGTAEAAKLAKDSPEAKAPAAQSGSPWPKRFRGFGDWEMDQKKAVGKELLADMGARFSNAKVKEVLDEDELELRARHDDIPFRVKYEADMGWVNLEMKCSGPIEDVSLEWDLEKVPVHSDDDDDWDDDDEIRVFVGKGVFIEGYKSSVNDSLAQFASLPGWLQAEIVGTMQRLELTRFMILSESINVGFSDNSYEMADPVAMVTEAVKLMAKTATTIGSGEVVVGQTSSGGARVAITPVNLVSCSYCRTKFNLGASSRCPNCGGSFEG